jgi:hypothetical protein
VVLYASEARTTTPTPESITNTHYRGILVTIDVSAISDTPSVVFTVQYQDHAGNWIDIVSSAAVTATGQAQLLVYPGAPSTANESYPYIVPPTWRLAAVHADSDSITYSASFFALP